LNRRKQDLLLALRIITDMLMVCVSWVLAFGLRFSGLMPIPKGVPDFALYLKLIPFICVIWFGVLAANGFYRRTGRHRSAFIEALDILQSCFMATLGFIAFTYVYEEYRYSRVVMLIFASTHPWAVITGRSAIRKALRRYRRKSAPRRTLVVGGGEILEHAVHLSLQGDIARGEILGVILVGNAEQRAEGEAFVKKQGLTLLPMQSDWADFFSHHRVASVVFAVPNNAYEVLDKHLDAIADQVPDVRFVPDLVRFTRFAASVDVASGMPVISINESPLEGLGGVIKRGVDICGALVGIFVFGPLMAVLAIAVKLSSPGPVVYVQERMGLDGRTFRMYKFRSMPVDAEKESGPVWMSADDKRPTKIGRFLRGTNLDELPQFFNVLRGDMSLVGPRPERPMFVEQFRRKVPGYYLRHKTKAGMTGWAQVNGWRGNTSIERRIECDLFYIQNWSLWFDVRIIFLTVLKSFADKNAY
jgi:Undecaprenyl-phosphate glucose phosphotransferase